MISKNGVNTPWRCCPCCSKIACGSVQIAVKHFLKHASSNRRRQLARTNERLNTMKTANSKNLLSTGVAITLAINAWLPTTTIAADEPMKPMKGGEHLMMVNTQQGADVQPADGKTMMMGKMMAGTNMMERCMAMKQQQEKMMSDMKMQDAELTAQVAGMNSAPENKKVELISAVITRMVEQHISMNARKAKMDEEMMKHMMAHMQMGGESMSQCPMMKGMDDKAADGHDGHHPKQP